ncbi:thiamine phosphate synthase [Salipaludibacillus sp. CF4.18]|uniref:thiamine phosphate synthase n=1 Tax=Salipaludibacillus sp. CF4.18 TaxID=3373081 RepID=UPI003EE564EC
MNNLKTETLREALGVYFIMGSQNCITSPQKTLDLALNGGVSIFQFREKGEDAFVGTEKRELAKELQVICRKNNISFIVNDDLELVKELDADGIHIGQDDKDLKYVRRAFPDKIIGISAHTLEEVEKAVAGGADYLGVGPIYATETKKDTKEVKGTTLIEQIRDHGYTIPIVGIGGINAKRTQEVILAGADGVSVITAISKAESPEKASQEIKSEVTQAKKIKFTK